jgi:hypothetical protein
LFFVLYVAFAITGVYHGTGQHTADIQPATEIPIGLKVSQDPEMMHFGSISTIVSHQADVC